MIANENKYLKVTMYYKRASSVLIIVITQDRIGKKERKTCEKAFMTKNKLSTNFANVIHILLSQRDSSRQCGPSSIIIATNSDIFQNFSDKYEIVFNKL